jgi:hypothetical protein
MVASSSLIHAREGAGQGSMLDKFPHSLDLTQVRD